MDYQELSREVSYALRHAPWEYELELDREGYVPCEELLDALNRDPFQKKRIELSDLENMIKSSEKKRHEIINNKIRALYGHSIDKTIAKERATPPEVLYHGTSHEAIESILKNGLIPMKRQYVHMSCDQATAEKVGKRKDKNPIILKIDSSSAAKDGIPFYIGNDSIWLADKIAPKYLQII